MKRILNIFFVSLGVIFFLILLLLGYLHFTTNLFSIGIIPEESVQIDQVGTSTDPQQEDMVEDDRKKILTPSQEQALETIGIDPSQVPGEFTSAQIACFERVLGANRVEEIKAGATPTISEALVGRGCL